MEQMSINLKQLRNRFVSDMNLPIQVVQSPYFEDRLDLLEEEFGARTKYEKLLKIIDEKFEGNSTKFLEHYAQVRNDIITKLVGSQKWFDFTTGKIGGKAADTRPRHPYKNLYTQEQDSGMFISFDMKKANFQALKYVDPDLVLGADEYEEMVGMFTDLDYIKESKYTRQVIFGQMNPKRTMTVEKKIVDELVDMILEGDSYLNKIIDFSKFDLFSVNSDEAIFKFNGSEEEFESLEGPKDGYVLMTTVVFRFNKFKLNHRQFKLATSDSRLNVYQKIDYLDGRRVHLHCVPSTYYPQVYKLLNGLELKPTDLVFYFEHELCQFMNPLELVK